MLIRFAMTFLSSFVSPGVSGGYFSSDCMFQQLIFSDSHRLTFDSYRPLESVAEGLDKAVAFPSRGCPTVRFINFAPGSDEPVSLETC